MNFHIWVGSSNINMGIISYIQDERRLLQSQGMYSIEQEPCNVTKLTLTISSVTFTKIRFIILAFNYAIWSQTILGWCTSASAPQCGVVQLLCT